MKYGLSEEQLAEICNIIGSYPQIEAAVIYGSRADGAYKEASDVDIAIKGEKTNESLAAKLKFHLEEETYLPFFFDVIAYNAITSIELKNQIKVKGKTIYRRGWREVKLGDVVEIIGGGTPSTKEPKYWNGDIPWLTPRDLSDFKCRYIAKGERNISKLGLQNSNAKLLPVGAVLLTTRAPVGYLAIARDEIAVNQGFKGLIANRHIDNLFLYYLLKHNVDYLKAHSSGTTFGELSKASLTSIPFYIPSLPEQKAIAEVLSSLDDKIDLLHRQNKTLENMAQILFQKWFIDDADDTWEKKKLVEIMDINPKYNLKKGTLAPYLEMSNIDVNSHTPLNWCNRAFKSGMRFQNGDTLFARITPCLENGKACFVDFLKENETGWGSTEYIIMRSKPNLPPLLSYVIAKNNIFRNYAIGTMIGTSGRQRAQATSLEEYPIYIPPPIILEKFSKQCEDITLKLKNNTLQLRALDATRDALLPKLMNGQVRVGGF